MTSDQVAEQNAGLRRRVAVLEEENRRLREAVEFTLQTLDLHRDQHANPLAKIVDRERAEKMLRGAMQNPTEEGCY